jgi:hypothetical protein
MRKQAIVRRIAGLAVAGTLALGAASAGLAQTGDPTAPYQPAPPLTKCLKKAKKKSSAQARKNAKKQCHKKYG